MGVYRRLFLVLMTIGSLLFPTVAAAEEQADVLMSIQAFPDHAGRVRIFIQKAYGADLDFARDIIYVPYVNEYDHWDPDLRIEAEGPVSVEYMPGNIGVRSTGPGYKLVRVWFTAQAALTKGSWGDLVYRTGWMVRPDFAELGLTRVQARTVFPPGLTPDWTHSGIHVYGSPVPSVTERWADGWLIDEMLRPGNMAEIEVAFRVPSASVNHWMISASLALSSAAFALAIWITVRQRNLGSP